MATIILDCTKPHGRYFIRQVDDTYYLERQPINPKTGKPWQASRKIGTYKERSKAMREWLYSTLNPNYKAK